MGFIDRPREVWWRKAIFQIHLWAGIVLAVYVVIISISGTVLIFNSQVTDDTPRIPRQADSVDPSLLTRLVTLAHNLHPDYRLSAVLDESWRGRALDIFLTKNTEAQNRRERSYRDVYFDPFTGRLLADREPNYRKDHPVFSFILDLHLDLLAGRTGRQINSIAAGFLLLLCVTGIVVWWPGRRSWKQGLTVHWKARWKRINFDSHRAIGFWTLLLVSMWAVTRVYFGYARPIRNALATILPFAQFTPYPKTDWKPGRSVLPIDNLYRDAQKAMPGERIRSLSLPRRPGDPVYVSFAPSRSPAYLHPKQVLLDPRTGRGVCVRDGWKEGKVGNHLLSLLIMLHFAEFDSLPLRILFALLGLSPAVLTITGVLMWWNRVLSKRWKQMRKTKKERVSQYEPEAPDLALPAIVCCGLQGQSSTENLSPLDDGRS